MKSLHQSSRSILAVLALTLAADAESIHLTDPSLENPFSGTNGSVTSGWWTFNNTYTAGGVEVGGVTGADGPNAARAIQINANDGGSLYQTVELDAGVTYTLTVAVGMPAATAHSDGRFALVFFNRDFSRLEAGTSGVIATRGSFTDDSVEFTPAVSGIYQAGMRNLGYVPGTGADNDTSTILFDHVRLSAAQDIRTPWQPPPRPVTSPYLPSPVDPGPAGGSVDGDTATLSNSVITATWKESNGSWHFDDATNLLSGQVLSPASPAPLFEISLADGTVLTPANLAITGRPTLEALPGNPDATRITEQRAGRLLRLEFTSDTGGLRILWQAELRDGAHFIRPSIEITKLDATPVTLGKVAMVSMDTDGFAVRGSVDGSPALSDDFFVAHESPMAKTTTSSSSADAAIGSWDVAGTSPAWNAVETYDVTRWAGLGELTIRFDYRGGPHRLNIHGVELLEDGIVIDDDPHFGYAGLPSVANTYRLGVPAFDPAKTYRLRANLSIDEDHSNSSGAVVLVGVPGQGGLVSSVTGQQVITATSPARHSSVLGVLIPGQERRSFLAYIESIRAHPYRSYLHYNSWLDVSWEVAGDSIMTEVNALSSMRGHIDQLVVPYNEPYDGFVFDDGWDDWDSLWDFDPMTFPRRFEPLDGLATTHGTSIGAWLSPFGGYGTAREARLAYGSSQTPPYETNNGGFSLAGPNYFSAFRDRCLRMIADYDFSYFKFDGIGAGNGASGAGAEYFPDIAAMLDLVEELRGPRGDLFINLTVGSWPSPFWLGSVDSLWRAGADMGLLGAGNNHERWITYRDRETYHNVVGRAPFYPLNSVMVHGITWANHGPANDPDFNSASFKSDLRAYFGSGTNLQELYLSPGKLGPVDWRNLAEGIKWSRENQDVLADTRWIGGDPEAGEIYGWAAWRPDKGLLTLRNPAASPAGITLSLAEAFELPPGASPTYHLKSPWVEDAVDTPVAYSASESISLSLGPFEVVTLEATPEAPPAWHADTAYREWARRLPSGTRTPDDPFGRAGFANLLAFTAGLDPSEVSGDPTLPFTTRVNDGSVEVHYIARQNPGGFGLKPQVSTDLASWHDGPGHFTELERNPLGNGTEQVRARLDDGYLSEPHIFIRWSASD